MRDALSFDRAPLGTPVHLSDVYRVIQDVDGVLASDIDELQAKRPADRNRPGADRLPDGTPAPLQAHLRIFPARPSPPPSTAVEPPERASRGGVARPGTSRSPRPREAPHDHRPATATRPRTPVRPDAGHLPRTGRRARLPPTRPAPDRGRPGGAGGREHPTAVERPVHRNQPEPWVHPVHRRPRLGTTSLFDASRIASPDNRTGAVPDLTGPTLLSPVAVRVRADVAKTIYYRRRKGTLPMVEELARDVTGWPAHAVEFFQLLGWNQMLEHPTARRARGPDVRSPRSRWKNPRGVRRHQPHAGHSDRQS